MRTKRSSTANRSASQRSAAKQAGSKRPAAKRTTAKPPVATEHIHYHRDGSIWARGQVVGDVPTGYWEWFRKDGTKMRSGFFEDGQQVGEWTTYDQLGQVYKVTRFKPGDRRRRAKSR